MKLNIGLYSSATRASQYCNESISQLERQKSDWRPAMSFDRAGVARMQQVARFLIAAASASKAVQAAERPVVGTVARQATPDIAGAT
jgi:hypothetical protein